MDFMQAEQNLFKISIVWEWHVSQDEDTEADFEKMVWGEGSFLGGDPRKQT